jgi:hypothetical protein
MRLTLYDVVMNKHIDGWSRDIVGSCLRHRRRAGEDSSSSAGGGNAEMNEPMPME